MRDNLSGVDTYSQRRALAIRFSTSTCATAKCAPLTLIAFSIAGLIACVPESRPTTDKIRTRVGSADLGADDQGSILDLALEPDLGWSPDAGPADQGGPDQGLMTPEDQGVDLGAADLGPTDLDVSDLGGQDLGPPDSGTPDLGTPDAGWDGGVDLGVDAGALDGGLPTGQFVQVTNHSLPGLYYGGLAAADFDQDGRIDLVMAGAWDKAFATPNQFNFNGQDRVRLYRNISSGPGDIRFTLVAELPNVRGAGGAIVRTGHFDSDGRIDFAVQFRDGSAPASDTSAFLNQGNWQFDRSVVQAGFDTQNNSLGMDVADIDQDGRDDLVFINTGANTGPGLWYRLSGASWQAQQTGFRHEISYGGALAAGDLDGDGYPEIAVGGNGSGPFGSYDCTSSLLYGQTHRNTGAMGPGFSSAAMAALGHFALGVNPSNPPQCAGMDNAGLLIADVNLDGRNDILLAGSMSNFAGPAGTPWSHYDLAVLYNNDGSGQNFALWQNAGPPFPGGIGATNGGAGNIDFPNMALGDVDADGLPDLLVQGHHKDYSDGVGGSYRFDTRLYRNMGTGFADMNIPMPQLAECGGAIADLDNDGKPDFVYCGASLPFHTNGANGYDYNDASTIYTVVFRNDL